ncbi:MAG: exopolysaccharide biosynthesis polyprenyl glycosylphosphotransferase [Bacteroidaceae bacterium]
MSNKHFEGSISSQIIVNVIDIAFLCASGFLALFVSRHLGQHDITLAHTQRYLIISILCYIPTAVLFPPVALRRVSSTDKIAGNTFLTSTFHFVVFLLIVYLLRIDYLPRIFFLSMYMAFTTLLLLERLSIFKYVSSIRRNGTHLARVILVGNGMEMHELYYDLKECTSGLIIEGLFSLSSDKETPENITLRGEPAHALEYLKENSQSIDAVYCSMASLSQEEARELYAYCENHMIRFYMVPVFVNLTRRHMIINQIGSSFVLSPRKEPLHEMGNQIIKRAIDLMVSSAFLLTVFPFIYTIVAIIIKYQSPGPVFSRQRRNGLNGKEFDCIRFRTEHINSDVDNTQGVENKMYRFPFGDFMRKSHVDNLPQFINVLFGNMSLVGPRPHLPAHTEEYRKIVDQYMVRHWVKPGITGWEQIKSSRNETRYQDQMENRVHADIWYVENWSFWLDIRIMMSTLFKTMFHKE